MEHLKSAHVFGEITVSMESKGYKVVESNGRRQSNQIDVLITQSLKDSPRSCVVGYEGEVFCIHQRLDHRKSQVVLHCPLFSERGVGRSGPIGEDERTKSNKKHSGSNSLCFLWEGEDRREVG